MQETRNPGYQTCIFFRLSTCAHARVRVRARRYVRACLRPCVQVFMDEHMCAYVWWTELALGSVTR